MLLIFILSSVLFSRIFKRNYQYVITMKKFAVFGNPIEHSKSPKLHHAFAKKMQIELEYQKQLVPLDKFKATVQHFFEDGGHGLNVTVPFKEEAFQLCDALTERANTAQAVNTLWYENQKIYGDNTDGQGLVDAINALGWTLANGHILILGAGGATRGVILPLAQAGVRSITIANRTEVKANLLVQELQPKIKQTQLEALPLNALKGEFDLVINATSASLSGNALHLPQELIFHHAYEMAYGKPSTFLEEAKKRHVPYSDGWGMLVGQAIEAFHIWHQVRPNLKDFL